MGENFERVMENYFKVFEEKMNNRFRIPPKLVEEYKDDICFMVDYDRVYIQAVIPRVAWVKPLPYEVNNDEARDIIEALVNELADPKLPTFGTYEEAKKMIHKIMGLPMLSKAKTTKTLGQEELQKKTLAKWDGRGLKFNNVTNVELRFGIHIITHKIYISIQLNNIPCEAVDLAYKVMKKNLEFDLLDLLLK